MKVLVIDPVLADIREEEWDGGIDQLHKWCRTDIVSPTKTTDRMMLWVDEEGIRKRRTTPRWMIPSLYPQVIYGAGVLTMGIKKDVPPGLREKLMKEIKWGLMMGPSAPTAGNA